MADCYAPVRLIASGTVFDGMGGLVGFLCTTAGNVQIRETNAAGAIVVAAFPVAVGEFYLIPFAFANGCYADLTGGCAGTFARE